MTSKLAEKAVSDREAQYLSEFVSEIEKLKNALEKSIVQLQQEIKKRSGVRSDRG